MVGVGRSVLGDGDARELLDAFSKVPGQIKRPPTFMDIANYPRRENVCSDILRFFLDPKEPHGLGTLILDALTSAAGIGGPDESIGRNVVVRREVPTNEGRERKRIDLLIETDTHVLLVENKIDARSENPFAEYADYLDRMAEGRIQHRILLTLSRNDAGYEYGFRNLTYDKFIDQMRSRLGHHVADADHRYLTLLLDFLNTLEDLKRGTRMNKEFVQLLAERQEQVQPFLTGIESLKAEMREKLQVLKGLIQLDKHPKVQQLKPQQDPTFPYDYLPHNIRVSKDLMVRVGTTISPMGWEIWIHPLEGSYSDLKSLLQRLEIQFEEYEEEEEGVLHRDSYKHKYDDDLEGISSLLQELIDKIATSRRRK